MGQIYFGDQAGKWVRIKSALTGTDRVLVSDDFIYFGGYGPMFPPALRDFHGVDICKAGIGRSCFDDPVLLAEFVSWIRSFNMKGFVSAPFEWRSLRGKD